VTVFAFELEIGSEDWGMGEMGNMGEMREMREMRRITMD
jgi:hypothetical protein